jgi:adenylate cyclase
VIFESRGRKSLRNVSEPVDLFAVLRAGESGTGNFPIYPVCRMAVDPERAQGQLTYEGTAYFFCSLTCAGMFAQNPAGFAA